MLLARSCPTPVTDVDIKTTGVYSIEDARQHLTGSVVDVDGMAPLVGEKFASAIIPATKPQNGCCGPDWCAGPQTAGR